MSNDAHYHNLFVALYNPDCGAEHLQYYRISWIYENFIVYLILTIPGVFSLISHFATSFIANRLSVIPYVYYSKMRT